jgi:hypothetical protein
MRMMKTWEKAGTSERLAVGVAEGAEVGLASSGGRRAVA